MPKSHILAIGTVSPSEVGAEANFLAGLHAEFIRIVGVNWVLPDDLRAEAVRFLKGVGLDCILAETARRNCIVAILNSKFRLNQGRLQSFYDAAALRQVYFDLRTKEHLAVLFNRGEKQKFLNWIGLQGLCADFESFFDPVTPEESLARPRQMSVSRVTEKFVKDAFQDDSSRIILEADIITSIKLAYPLMLDKSIQGVLYRMSQDKRLTRHGKRGHYSYSMNLNWEKRSGFLDDDHPAHPIAPAVEVQPSRDVSDDQA